MSLDHQDFKIITFSKNTKNLQKNIIPRNNNVDLHKIKIENETENFKIQKIPNKLVREIIDARNIKKITQKEMAVKLNIQLNIYNDIESGKAIYNQQTKEIIQKIQRLFSIKFENK
jgi:putative transcription factor